MIKEIKYHLYDDNNAMESSLLRGILLFNCLEKRRSRKDFIPRAVFSIIVEGDGNYTDSEILSIFNERFKYGMSQGELTTIVQNLKNEGHLSADGKVVLSNRNGKEYYEAIDLETSNLFDRIIFKTGLLLGGSVSNTDIVKENIRRALSVYFKLYGYSFFDLQENSWDDRAEEAISNAMENLSEREGRALVKVIGETLNNNNVEDQSILNQWARAFIMMEIISLDPSLRNFKAEKLRGKEFVLDTDFVLRCLTTSLEQSKPYKTIICQLRKLGCKMFLPKEVFAEVNGHIQEARSTYNRVGDGIKTFPVEAIRNGFRNVFLEDYVTLVETCETKKDMSFPDYINNFYDSRNKDLLKSVFESIFGEEAIYSPFDIQVPEADMSRLQEKILEYTNTAVKADVRSDIRKSEISKTDAYLYLATSKKNVGTTGDTILSRKSYLLTRSTRAAKAAKDVGLFQKNIVCHPNALISILEETGNLDGGEINIVNLFDNPFLAYTAKEIWSVISPIIGDARYMKYSRIEKLRNDVDFQLDLQMTSQNGHLSSEKRKQKIKNALEVMSVEDVEQLKRELANAQKQLQITNTRVEELEKDNQKITKEIVRLRSTKAITKVKGNATGRKRSKRSCRKKH